MSDKGKPFLAFAVICSCIVCLFSCAQHGATISPQNPPKFEGRLSPISIPVTSEYTPVSFGFTFFGKKHINILETKKKTVVETELVGSKDISRLGPSLLWNITVNKFTIGSKTFSPAIPIIECRLLTDVKGNVRESETSAPALDPNKFKIAEEQYRHIEEELKVFCKLHIWLPTSDVTTGDVVYREDKVDIVLSEFPEFPEFSKTVDREKLAQDLKKALSGREYLEYIIKGWSYHKSKKVIVAAIDDSEVYSHPRGMMDVNRNGFCLLDYDSFQIVFHKVLTKFKLRVTDDITWTSESYSTYATSDKQS